MSATLTRAPGSGSGNTAGYIARLIDPAALARECRDRDWPTSQFEGRATVATMPVGREPGTVTVLLSRADLDSLGAGPLTLTIPTVAGADSTASTTFVFAGLYLSSAVQVLPGADDDPAAVYLASLADKRLLLSRKLIDRAFNLKGHNGVWIDSTIKTAASSGAAGVPYTWQEMLDQIWQAVPAIGGTAGSPALPFAPQGTPEGIECWATSAWGAWNDVIERVACVSVIDPATAAISIVRAGAVSGGTPAAARVWAAKPIDPPETRSPSTIAVRFRRRPEPPRNRSPWYIVRVTTGADAKAIAGTEITIDDDLFADRATGDPTNLSDLTNRANDRAADWRRRRNNFAKPEVVAWAGHDTAWGPAAAGQWAGAIVVRDDGRGPITEAGGGAVTQLPVRPVAGRTLAARASATGDGRIAAKSIKLNDAGDAWVVADADDCWLVPFPTHKVTSGVDYVVADSGCFFDSKPIYGCKDYPTGFKCATPPATGIDVTYS